MAGLVDGEGYVGIGLTKNNLGTGQITPKPVYRPRMSVVNRHRGALEWIVERFGGNILEKPTPEQNATCYSWNRSGSNVVQAILRQIRPYLIIKAVQADLVLEFPANAVCGRWDQEKTLRIRAEKDALYRKLLELNQRGPGHEKAQRIVKARAYPPKKPLCDYGHELVGWNLMNLSNGRRRCRTCHNAQVYRSRGGLPHSLEIH